MYFTCYIVVHFIFQLKKDYIVSIVDVNEPPTDIVVFNNDDMTISEGSRTNEAVANIKIFDADLVERLQLEIVYGKEIFKIAPAGLSCSVVSFYDI